ncbi:MAG: outer membrane protein assembly factor BamD [Desulfohalobiaceae bacterium]|nr:outer membrane protein assembly factor BamD [Desulfohalobiaceae bacterium]
MNKKRRFPLLLFIGLICLMLSGCGALNPFSSSKEPDSAAALLQAGKRAMEKGNYKQAAKYYQRIKEDHPFSRQTTEAGLGLADAYFQQEKYSAAESAYKEFESMHPGHPEIPYVLFRMGRANLKQFTSIDLTQDNVQQAEEYFTRLVQAYPQSEFANEAERYLARCRRLIAQHEIYVADFYMRTEQYRAAWKRYSSILDSYDDLKELTSYARSRATEAYYRYMLQASEKVRTALRGSWREWFDWL